MDNPFLSPCYIVPPTLHMAYVECSDNQHNYNLHQLVIVFRNTHERPNGYFNAICLDCHVDDPLLCPCYIVPPTLRTAYVEFINNQHNYNVHQLVIVFRHTHERSNAFTGRVYAVPHVQNMFQINICDTGIALKVQSISLFHIHIHPNCTPVRPMHNMHTVDSMIDVVSAACKLLRSD